MKLLRIVLTGEENPHYTITDAFKKAFDIVDTIYWDEFKDYRFLNEVVIARASAHKYDAIFMQLQAPNIITPETARELSKKCLVFNWSGDVRKNIDWYKEMSPFVITLFTNVHDVLEIRKVGGRAEYLQCGYDHKYYFNRNIARLNNVAFCGNFYPEMQFPLTTLRVNTVRLFKKTYPENFNLYGSNWDKADLKSEGIADNEKEALLYNVTSLALSISHFNYSRYFSDRLLREMACGCCVLSHRFEDCDLEFTDLKHIVFWDNEIDLIQKAEYYLNNPEKAREIGDEAARFVSQNYSWNVFTENFKKIIKNYQ